MSRHVTKFAFVLQPKLN